MLRRMLEIRRRMSGRRCTILRPTLVPLWEIRLPMSVLKSTIRRRTSVRQLETLRQMSVLKFTTRQPTSVPLLLAPPQMPLKQQERPLLMLQRPSPRQDTIWLSKLGRRWGRCICLDLERR